VTRLSKGQRALAYGLAGWCSEIVSTSIRSRGRDNNWRLTGTTYAWMLPVYGVAAVLFEPIDDVARRRDWPWWQRGLAWTAGIYAVEAASGEALRVVTGEVPWDYSRPRGVKPVPAHWRGLVRPAYAPVWFTVGMGMERLRALLDRVDIAPADSAARARSQRG
jgi:Putative ABC-transporter type IV